MYQPGCLPVISVTLATLRAPLYDAFFLFQPARICVPSAHLALYLATSFSDSFFGHLHPSHIHGHRAAQLPMRRR
jgi:hypothetical protein